MPIKLNTASGGGVILTGANTASDKTITVPAADGTMNMSGAANEVPAGSASAPAIYPTGDTNTGIFFPAADTMAFAEGGVESARIDSSGRLMVNTTVTSFGSSEILSIGAGAVGVVGTSSTSVYSLYIQNTAGSGASSPMIRFSTSNGVSGTIISTTTSTTYATSSDYRLKHDIAPMTGALAKIAALKPVTYKWNADNSEGEGFIAHELQAVCPDAVTGEKDGADENGDAIYQGIDTSFLVATLTAAIQEQQQMIETLQAKVAALEAK